MRDHKPIQINIPTPCFQDWSKMTPTDQGWFCAHCRKSVIDFSEYSDAALYRFFAQNTEDVCGRFLKTQLNRDIIPSQPHSRLYRLFIGLGFTLLFTQTGGASARACPPMVTENSFCAADGDNKPADSTGIGGRILDEEKEPMVGMGAYVQVYQDGVVKGGAAVDEYGYYYVILPGPRYLRHKSCVFILYTRHCKTGNSCGAYSCAAGFQFESNSGVAGSYAQQSNAHRRNGPDDIFFSQV